MEERIVLDEGRFLADLEELGGIGAAPGEGRTRLALSDEDGEARRWLVRRMEELGLEIRVDGIGNLFGILPGEEGTEAPVTAGSHLDTVIRAGALDGAYGVLGALAVLRGVRESGTRLRRPLAVAAFTNEEGVRFQPDMMGSLVLSGRLPLEEALAARDREGLRAGEELERLGFRGTDRVTPGAYLELHIEQGPRLEDAGARIGVVEGIQGIAWWGCTYRGQANHAGTTPMDRRRDAFAGVADLSRSLRELAARVPSSVATLGRVEVRPGAINVVPGRVDFTVDVRAEAPESFGRLKEEVPRLLREAADRHALELGAEALADAPLVRFPREMTDLVDSCARGETDRVLRLASGAGHDAQFLHFLCPTAMIFVPSRGGLSHCPEEHTEAEDLLRGVRVLARGLIALAQREA